MCSSDLNTKLTRYGNTVFISHIGTDNNKDLVFGRAFNADTARNFVKNGEIYFRDLYQHGIRRYFTQFDQKSYAAAFERLKKRPLTSDMQIEIVDAPDGQTQVAVVFAGEML